MVITEDKYNIGSRLGCGRDHGIKQQANQDASQGKAWRRKRGAQADLRH
jgi:hypothetical protein